MQWRGRGREREIRRKGEAEKEGDTALGLAATGGNERALAQLAYNDEKVKEHFNMRICNALEHRSEEESSDLEEIGREIVKKCGGLPLAAKAIGSAMCSRMTRREWEFVLRSEIWNSGDVLGGILPALLLTNHDLPPALKHCFSYFSIFPKDWEIEKDMIVKLWVAQGFIRCEESEDMEEIGRLYFDDLLRRSLLQVAEFDYYKNILNYKMHDLVHDLAQFVAGSDCSLVEIRKQALLNLNNLRHSFLIVSDEADEVACISSTLYKAPKLRMLLLHSSVSMVPQILFHHWRRLRALDLSNTSIKKLPPTVGQLKHLRFLDLSDTGVEELPEGVSNCINLQTLRLNYYKKLRKLPRGMKKMISLRHLEFERFIGIKYLPKGIGRLTGLQTLTKFIMGGDDDEGCNWGELKYLNNLLGRLEITGLENVMSRDEAREAELYKKQHLHSLYLHYVYRPGEALDDEVKRMEVVIEILQPHTNLKELEIYNYKGEVRKVGGEFTGDDNNAGSGGGGVSFLKLETLIFFQMPKWERGVGIERWRRRGYAISPPINNK
ncbi:putative disease resistance protein RGA3 [Magnolia sinica]|uniref:putative disease resistance protein RGA3 n=1 Tax=Magnolia sinica TaxID=86752 RepID=UPI002659A915|nr:putative disease resistance protein RGA3 [Magnolia sinica]